MWQGHINALHMYKYKLFLRKRRRQRYSSDRKRRKKQMAKLSEKYEAVFVYTVKKGEDTIRELSDKFLSLIKKSSSDPATVVVSDWGKRRLAYPINYENDGYYQIITFDSKPDFPAELERVVNITEGVLRFLTVLRKEEPARPVKPRPPVPVQAPEPAAVSETPAAAEPAESQASE